MEKRIFHIKGMNLRVQDHAAPDGTARSILNAYPLGDSSAPRWVPMREPSIYLDMTEEDYNGDIGYKILSASFWYRNNAPSALVYIRKDAPAASPAYDRLCMREIDAGGTFTGTETELFVFPDSDEQRDALWTQVGEHLAFTLQAGFEPGDTYIVMTYEGVAKCFPLNLDVAPKVTITPADDTATTLYSYGIRVGYELVDGTIQRLSAPTLRSYDWNNYRSLVVSMASADKPSSTYKPLIKNVVVLLSQPVIGDDQLLHRGQWHVVGKFDPFDDSDNRRKLTYRIPADSENPPILETVKSSPLFDEDLLCSHAVFPKVLGSYNRQTLLGAVSYDYVKPESFAFTQTGLIYQPPLNRRRADVEVDGDGILFDAILTWLNPTGATEIHLYMASHIVWEYFEILHGWRRRVTESPGPVLLTDGVRPVTVPAGEQSHTVQIRLRDVANYVRYIEGESIFEFYGKAVYPGNHESELYRFVTS